MPLVFADRVKETSTSVGLSSFTLDGAISGFRTFVTGIGNGNQCHYVIESEADSTWEVGVGTVAGATLSRDAVLSSSNSNLPVNFAAGTKQVFATEAADHFLSTLTAASHALEDHDGLPGIPAPEAFTAAAHLGVDHTGLDGVPDAETFTSAAHDADDHSGVTAIEPPSQAEAEAGTSTTPRLWTAQRVKNSIDALGGGGGGGWDPASHNADDHSGVTAIQPPLQAEAEAGVATIARLWTAQRVAQAISAQAFKVATQTYTAASTISIAPGFIPVVAIFIGKYTGLTQVNTIGYATGTPGGAQGCTVAGALGSTTGAVAADSGGGTSITESHLVTTFNNSNVEATQSAGSATWNGIVIVLGMQF